MSASVQDSLKNIQAGRVSRSSPPPVLRSPTALQKSISALSIQPQSSSTAHDRFSLLGLNSVIRMVNEDLSMLALGQDLTVLGLKLDHPGKDLHKTFISPWSDHQAPNPKQDFEIPACYDVNNSFVPFNDSVSRILLKSFVKNTFLSSKMILCFLFSIRPLEKKNKSWLRRLWSVVV